MNRAHRESIESWKEPGCFLATGRFLYQPRRRGRVKLWREALHIMLGTHILLRFYEVSRRNSGDSEWGGGRTRVDIWIFEAQSPRDARSRSDEDRAPTCYACLAAMLNSSESIASLFATAAQSPLIAIVMCKGDKGLVG